MTESKEKDVTEEQRALEGNKERTTLRTDNHRINSKKESAETSSHVNFQFEWLQDLCGFVGFASLWSCQAEILLEASREAFSVAYMIEEEAKERIQSEEENVELSLPNEERKALVWQYEQEGTKIAETALRVVR